MNPASVAHYLHSLQKELARGDATEHTYRPALKALLEAHSKDIRATNEPKSAERENKPDYVVRKNTTIIGFVEAKDIDKDLKAIRKSPQLKRYLEALPNLILTNYLDFVWFVGGEKRLELSLGVSDGRLIKAASNAAAEWDNLLASFVNEIAPTIATPFQLAKSLAGQTRLLRDLAKELLEAEDADLLEQEQSFKSMLVPDLKPEEFADMYAQTAAYGLFTARVFEFTTMYGAPVEPLPDSLKDQHFNLEKAAFLIPKANPFLRQFFQHVASPNLNAQLRWLVEQIADSLAHTDMQKVLHGQSRKQGFEDPVFHFYETFLAEYDKKLRESRGVYYTPEPVVDYIVRSVDSLLKEKFGKVEGLADPTALVLDPAAGTATFLRKVIELIHSRLSNQGMGGAWPAYVRTKLLPRLFGFELMMAPYTVAHLKLELQLQEQGFQFEPGERLHVYLTNTLDQLHQKTNAMLGQWIAKENEGAEAIKLHKPVEVVLGNPPYSGESRNKGDWIMELLKSYKTEPEGGPLKEKNSKWINDDYVKFIRFAHDRINRTGHGIVAFITNHGWLDNPTFRGMRAQVMADFDEIYVLDLHGNNKKKERTPEALKAHGDDKNVFDIEQGVSIALLVKLPATESPAVNESDDFQLAMQDAAKPKTRKLAGGKVTLKAQVRHAELWGAREYKYGWLESHSIDDTLWQALHPALPQLLFTPRNESLAEEYGQGWKITDIFPLYGTGIVTKCDELNIHFSDQETWEAVNWFMRASEAQARNKIRLPGPEVRDWNFKNAVKDITDSGPNRALIRQIAYRPFDARFTYYTGRSRGMMGWPVDRVMRHFADRENLGLISARSNKSQLMDHFFISDAIVETKCGESTTQSATFPLWRLSEEDTQEKTRTPNLAPAFLDALVLSLGRDKEPSGLPANTTPEDMLAYCYAVLHAPTYRSRYAEFLKSDFPRIPLAVVEGADLSFAKTWEALLPLGKELIDLHLLKDLHGAKPASFPKQGDNTVEKPRFDPPKDNQPGRVWINAAQYFEGVEPETWAFKIGGYQVCEKWLKDRKGRTLDFNDIQHYGKIVAALTQTRTLMAQIDSIATGRLWPGNT